MLGSEVLRFEQCQDSKVPNCVCGSAQKGLKSKMTRYLAHSVLSLLAVLHVCSRATVAVGVLPKP
jgi:hypothetical protein